MSKPFFVSSDSFDQIAFPNFFFCDVFIVDLQTLQVDPILGLLVIG